jgi:glycerophosphoryl diester phosphodiesterase
MDATSETDRPVEWIAHRGESYDAPENTLAAFRLAFERRIAAIELDVHLTADDELIVCHDADTLRTTGVGQLIRDSNLRDLQRLDAGRWKGSGWAGEKLPSLDEVVDSLPAGTRCFIEIKVGPESLPALERVARGHENKNAQMVIISFRQETVAEVKRKLPYLEAHLLSEFEHDKETLTWSPTAQHLIDRSAPTAWASTTPARSTSPSSFRSSSRGCVFIPGPWTNCPAPGSFSRPASTASRPTGRPG